MKEYNYSAAKAALLMGIMILFVGAVSLRCAEISAYAAGPTTALAGSGTGLAGVGTGQASSGTGSSAPSTSGALHVEGAKLVGSDGQPVQLRGISTHGIAWFPDYINEAAFRQFRTEWGANVVRLAMYTAEYGGYCSGGDKTQLKNLVRDGVRYATAQDLYVIIDWHILSDGDPNTHKEDAKAFFAEMAKEFAANNNVLYEICNEPNGGTTWQQIKAYANEIIPVIRANDRDAVIIVGTPNWSQHVDQAAADPITGYDNIMYALHFYAATHKDDLRTRMVGAVQKGLPVFVTEYGICDASGNGGIDEASANQWIRTMNQYGVSYVAWNLSNKAETSAIIQSGSTKKSGFTDSDLSASGKWLRNMLMSAAGASESRNGATAAQGAGQSGSQNSGGPLGNSGESTDSGLAGGAPSGDSKVIQSGNIRVTATVVNRWTSGGEAYTHYTMKLENTSGSSADQWTVTIPFTGSFRLTDSWNGDYTVSGHALTVTSKSYNGKIAAGGSVSDVGFIVAGAEIADGT